MVDTSECVVVYHLVVVHLSVVAWLAFHLYLVLVGFTGSFHFYFRTCLRSWLSLSSFSNCAYFYCFESLLERLWPYLCSEAVWQAVPLFYCSHCEGILSDVCPGKLYCQSVYSGCRPCPGSAISSGPSEVIISAYLFLSFCGDTQLCADGKLPVPIVKAKNQFLDRTGVHSYLADPLKFDRISCRSQTHFYIFSYKIISVWAPDTDWI
jgi:hypothetical protein